MRVLQCGEVRDAGEAEVRPGSLRELQGRVRGHLLVQGVRRRLAAPSRPQPLCSYNLIMLT